ncbi:hypothetical protein ACYULU_08490 [Breznakiellaceae bacterium SP9]
MKNRLRVLLPLVLLLTVSCDYISQNIKSTLSGGAQVVLGDVIWNGYQEPVNKAVRTEAPALPSTQFAAPDNPGLAKQPAKRKPELAVATLVKGNSWTVGIPGFGNNAFPAFWGEYRLRRVVPAEGESDGPFSVYANNELLLFPQPDWKVREPISGFAAYEQEEGARLSIAVIVDEKTNGTIWKLIFHFPAGIAALSLNEAHADGLLERWIYWFQYFQVQSPDALSFPSIVNY